MCGLQLDDGLVKNTWGLPHVCIGSVYTTMMIVLVNSICRENHLHLTVSSSMLGKQWTETCVITPSVVIINTWEYKGFTTKSLTPNQNIITICRQTASSGMVRTMAQQSHNSCFDVRSSFRWSSLFSKEWTLASRINWSSVLRGLAFSLPVSPPLQPLLCFLLHHFCLVLCRFVWRGSATAPLATGCSSPKRCSRFRI